MDYVFNEGRIELALEGRIDRSVNLLALPDGSDVSWVISRDQLRSGETLLQLVQRQLGELAMKVNGYQEVVSPRGMNAPTGVSAAVEWAGVFTQHGQSIHQRQSAMQLQGGDQVLVFTLSGFEPFDAASLRRWSSTLDSFKPRAA